MVTWQGKMITSHIRKLLYYHIHQHQLCKDMPHNDTPPELLQNNINLNASRMVREDTRCNMQILIAKWISGDLATGKKMAIREK